MATRLELQVLLVSLLGSNNVYFQPPASIQMKYPCIVYKIDRLNTTYANNEPYNHTTRYQVTVIDRNPDSPIRDRVGALPMSSHERNFAVDQLNHDVYTLFF